ncbi:MAG: class I SAM-dependent methyltransferase [Chloroflexota bacterium]
MPITRRQYDQAYFDSFIYRSHPRSRRNVKRLQLILTHKPQGRLLEIGSGGGEFLQLAASKFDAWSMDVSPYAASRLSPSLKERVTIGDVESEAIPNPPYDVVTAFNVLEHLRRPLATIRKIRQALAPDGILVGSVPCNASLLGSVHTAITNHFDRTHRSTYKVATWRKAFQKAGLPDTRLFGEFMLDGGVCLYLFTPLWPHLSLNMMFLARKSAASTPA